MGLLPATVPCTVVPCTCTKYRRQTLVFSVCGTHEQRPMEHAFLARTVLAVFAFLASRLSAV